MVVELADGCKRIDDESPVIYIEELRRPAAACRSSTLECLVPVGAFSQPDDIGACGISLEHPPRHVQRAAQRRYRLERVAMGLHDTSVGKHLKESLDLGDVPRILEQPTGLWLRRADQAQYIGVT